MADKVTELFGQQEQKTGASKMENAMKLWASDPYHADKLAPGSIAELMFMKKKEKELLGDSADLGDIAILRHIARNPGKLTDMNFLNNLEETASRNFMQDEQALQTYMGSNYLIDNERDHLNSMFDEYDKQGKTVNDLLGAMSDQDKKSMQLAGFTPQKVSDMYEQFKKEKHKKKVHGIGSFFHWMLDTVRDGAVAFLSGVVGVVDSVGKLVGQGLDTIGFHGAGKWIDEHTNQDKWITEKLASHNEWNGVFGFAHDAVETVAGIAPYVALELVSGGLATPAFMAKMESDAYWDARRSGKGVLEATARGGTAAALTYATGKLFGEFAKPVAGRLIGESAVMTVASKKIATRIAQAGITGFEFSVFSNIGEFSKNVGDENFGKSMKRLIKTDPRQFFINSLVGMGMNVASDRGIKRSIEETHKQVIETNVFARKTYDIIKKKNPELSELQQKDLLLKTVSAKGDGGFIDKALFKTYTKSQTEGAYEVYKKSEADIKEMYDDIKAKYPEYDEKDFEKAKEVAFNYGKPGEVTKGPELSKDKFEALVKTSKDNHQFILDLSDEHAKLLKGKTAGEIAAMKKAQESNPQVWEEVTAVKNFTKSHWKKRDAFKLFNDLGVTKAEFDKRYGTENAWSDAEHRAVINTYEKQVDRLKKTISKVTKGDLSKSEMAFLKSVPDSMIAELVENKTITKRSLAKLIDKKIFTTDINDYIYTYKLNKRFGSLDAEFKKGESKWSEVKQKLIDLQNDAKYMEQKEIVGWGKNTKSVNKFAEMTPEEAKKEYDAIQKEKQDTERVAAEQEQLKQRVEQFRKDLGEKKEMVIKERKSKLLERKNALEQRAMERRSKMDPDEVALLGDNADLTNFLTKGDQASYEKINTELSIIDQAGSMSDTAFADKRLQNKAERIKEGISQLLDTNIKLEKPITVDQMINDFKNIDIELFSQVMKQKVNQFKKPRTDINIGGFRTAREMVAEIKSNIRATEDANARRLADEIEAKLDAEEQGKKEPKTVIKQKKPKPKPKPEPKEDVINQPEALKDTKKTPTIEEANRGVKEIFEDVDKEMSKESARILKKQAIKDKVIESLEKDLKESKDILEKMTGTDGKMVEEDFKHIEVEDSPDGKYQSLKVQLDTGKMISFVYSTELKANDKFGIVRGEVDFETLDIETVSQRIQRTKGVGKAIDVIMASEQIDKTSVMFEEYIENSADREEYETILKGMKVLFSLERNMTNDYIDVVKKMTPDEIADSELPVNEKILTKEEQEKFIEEGKQELEDDLNDDKGVCR